MPWTFTSFLANRKSAPATAQALVSWPAEDTERLASGVERAELAELPRNEA